MSLPETIAKLAATPRTRVGPATSAADRTSGGVTWRGVWESPVDLHRAASLDRNTYAIARCIVSEVGTSNPYKALAAAETIVSAAQRKGIEPYQWLVSLTRDSHQWTRFYYGEQSGRRASTRQDPDARAVAAALHAQHHASELANGAVTWFEPDLQDSGRQGSHTLKHDAAGIATKWAAEDGLEWVGPLPQIDPYKDVAFLRFVGRGKADARPLLEVIRLGRAGQPTIGPSSPVPGASQVAATNLPLWALTAAAVALVIV